MCTNKAIFLTSLKIRNAPTKLMKDEGYGNGYEMYDAENLLPKKLSEKRYLPDA